MTTDLLKQAREFSCQTIYLKEINTIGAIVIAIINQAEKGETHVKLDYQINLDIREFFYMSGFKVKEGPSITIISWGCYYNNFL